ncbi:DUF4105 domain-containing protein [Pseudohongiella nitratireducens]|uniref:lipoprotein N-acyltransferase Lnb domain-containing protein n=1 Tax=Pseudohongiella nitratireducens TaxID=1768907 RepID=UPI0030EF4089
MAIPKRKALTSLVLRLLLCIVLLLLTAPLLLAQPTLSGALPDAPEVEMPANMDAVEFYLITVDTGNHVWDNFGHTALRVVDSSSDTDLIFNWGVFDTSGGNIRFARNFVRGQMVYQLGVVPPAWEFNRYRREQRTVWQDRLVLNSRQKARLYTRLAWNLGAENIDYDYDYFFDNCTTRLRDYLDEALQGELSENSGSLMPETFRDEVFEHYRSRPVIAFGLDVMMNERIDQRMTRWESLFLPANLRSELQRKGLLADPETLMEFTPPADKVNPYWVLAGFLVPLVLLTALVRQSPIAAFGSQPGFSFAVPGFSYRLLGLLALCVVLVSGDLGMIMALGWWLSGHADLHGNINLLLFWPTDLLLLGMVFTWFWKGRVKDMTPGRHQLWTFYFLLRILSLLAYLVVCLFNVSSQQTNMLLLTALPTMLLFFLLTMISGMRPVRGMRFY